MLDSTPRRACKDFLRSSKAANCLVMFSTFLRNNSIRACVRLAVSLPMPSAWRTALSASLAKYFWNSAAVENAVDFLAGACIAPGAPKVALPPSTVVGAATRTVFGRNRSGSSCCPLSCSLPSSRRANSFCKSRVISGLERPVVVNRLSHSPAMLRRSGLALNALKLSAIRLSSAVSSGAYRSRRSVRVLWSFCAKARSICSRSMSSLVVVGVACRVAVSPRSVPLRHFRLMLSSCCTAADSTLP